MINIIIAISFFILSAFIIRYVYKKGSSFVFNNLVTAIIYLFGSSSIVVTLMILFIVTKESIDFFQYISIYDFIFGKNWSPIDMKSVEIEPSFGALPLISGTLMIAIIAIMIAAPVGVFSAVYINFYVKNKKIKNKLKLIIEIMAGIPSIVYGFFAVLAVAPAICFISSSIGYEIDYENALSVGTVMAIMITPMITMVCIDTFANLPRNYLQGALAIGTTLEESIYSVLIPAARPGIISACILAFSRAIGETMLVVMALSLSANLTIDPTKPVTTITVQIVSLLTGDQSFDSPVMLSAFALGLLLFIITFTMNALAIRISNNFNKRFNINA